jgi:hypothetical protein
MQTKKLLSCVALIAMLVPVIGQSATAQERGEHESLAGTWNVTLQFPACSAQCPCPGGTPNIPIPAVQQYDEKGSMEELGGAAIFRGPGLGNWKRAGDGQFVAKFKFFTFNTSGFGTGSEVVTSNIVLTGDDAFEASSTFTLFNATGGVVGEGCNINATATRLE